MMISESNKNSRCFLVVVIFLPTINKITPHVIISNKAEIDERVRYRAATDMLVPDIRSLKDSG